MAFRSLEWNEANNTLRLIDQKRLPEEIAYLDLATEDEIFKAIVDMTVRGAPAIGVAAAYAMVSAASRSTETDLSTFKTQLFAVDEMLRTSRPTAVNLFWALDRTKSVIEQARSTDEIKVRLLTEACEIEADDVDVNRAISRHAMEVVPQKATFFHHCNTGSLATVDLGTALGVIRTAHESGREVMAYIDETRPRLQGAKLSAWELKQYGVPHAVIVDGASAHIMRTEGADLCVVGCDRVAANGDTANKIGTYGLALAAQDNGVPFYVCAPTSTIDLSTASGDNIEIETRDDREVTEINGVQITPEGAGVFNPAFDVTPARLITGIITEFGIARAPYETSLQKIFDEHVKS